MSQHQEIKTEVPGQKYRALRLVGERQQSTDSEIDLLIDFSEPMGMEIVDLTWELEAILGQ
ncbi:MAG: hypothetical protein ACLFOZ_05515 [Cyclobacteriaceae bacterium]